MNITNMFLARCKYAKVMYRRKKQH